MERQTRSSRTVEWKSCWNGGAAPPPQLDSHLSPLRGLPCCWLWLLLLLLLLLGCIFLILLPVFSNYELTSRSISEVVCDRITYWPFLTIALVIGMIHVSALASCHLTSNCGCVFYLHLQFQTIESDHNYFLSSEFNSSFCTAVNRQNLNEASSIFLFVQHFKDFNWSSVHLKWRAPSPVLLVLWHYANVRPLASRPLCSLPVIRLDYALLAVNASSANKFTMSIIIFRSSSTGKGQMGGQVSAGTFKHNNTAQWQHV